MDAMTSPIEGADGNVEFLVHLVAASPGAPPITGVDLVSTDALLSATVDDAATRRA
jgi:hypothetical protein